MASAEPSGMEGENKDDRPVDVKSAENNKYWTQQSSPETSPDVEPPVANLLTSANGPQNHLQHLESPEPDEPDDEPSAGQQARDGSAAKHVSLREEDRPHLPGTSEERLMQMPELRPLPVRQNHESRYTSGSSSDVGIRRIGTLLTDYSVV